MIEFKDILITSKMNHSGGLYVVLQNSNGLVWPNNLHSNEITDEFGCDWIDDLVNQSVATDTNRLSADMAYCCGS